jgi:tetratricopeptide (TPR) repeat protein
MNNRLILLIILILATYTYFTDNVSADTSLDESTLDLISNAVFEVVVPKPTEDSLSYEKPLPLHLLPYYIRTDNYYSIGSAFAISTTEFVTAVHVINLALNSQFKEVYLRDKDKNVYSINKIIKYSERRDFVVFSLKDKTTKEFFQINAKPRINEKVFAVGNAFGEGIVIRDGLYTSETPEDEEGEWKWIRFSAAASPGNSGGPLLDKDGKVIGIVLLKSPNENLNYALPITEVVSAKPDTAVIYSKGKYFLDNIYATSMETFKREISLPKSYQELKQELIEGTNWFTYNLLKSLFVGNKDNIFPNGDRANMLLHSNQDATFPGLITQKENGSWYVSYPKEMKDAELPSNGHLTYGNMGNSLFLSIQKPDDVPLDKFYNDSKLFMDLLLKGFYVPRQIGTENIKITSLGKAREEYVFIDSYGRKWLVRTWLLEFSDEKFVTFSLPVPGGCITMLRAGQTGLVEDGHIPDLKILTNFIYVSYYGTLKQWHEFLKAKDLLAYAFSSIDISFDYNKAFNYKSKRLSFSYLYNVMKISERSYIKLMFSYFKDNGKTVWDVGAVSVGENKGDETFFNITRNIEPAKELGDKYQNDWNNIVMQKFPFNKSAYYKDKTTNISTSYIKKSDVKTPVLYSVVYSKDGKVEQKEMETKLDRFVQNLIVYEEGQNNDVAYAGRKDSYHDKGDYYQALWDYERVRDINPHTVAGYILRGDVYKDKGDIDHALIDYGKALELNPDYAQIYLGKDFMPLIYGVRGQFREAKTEIENVLKSDPSNTLAEPLLKIIEDVLGQRIKNETAVYLFKGEALNHLGMLDAAFIEYNNAISSEPSYHVSYDIRGIANVYKKDIDNAISDYSKAIELNPKDVVAYNRRGVAYKIKKEYDKAIENFNKALEVTPEYVKAIYNRGNIYSIRNEHENAIADYDRALQIYPLDENAYYNRGIAWYNKGMYNKAIEDYNKTIEINPKNSDAFTSRGLAYFAKGEYEQAIKDYSKAIELNPMSDSAYNNRGIAYYNKGDKAHALSDYSKAIEINHSNSEAYLNRGNIYKDKGDIDNVISDYSESIKINPQNAHAYFNRGWIYQAKKELNLAIADYSKALEIEPNYSDAYLNRGNIYKDKGDIDYAISDYSNVIKINPNNDAAYYNRGNSFHIKGEIEQALMDYSKAIEINLNIVNAYHNRGAIYNNKGNFNEAIADYTKAIELNPRYDIAYHGRGYSYLYKGELDLAIADYSKAIEINPNYAEVYDNRGTAYNRKGNSDRAIADYSRVIEIDPKRTETYTSRGALYASKGDLEKALSDFNKALEINPRSANAFNERGIAHSRKGEYDNAISDLNKALEIDPKNAEVYNNRGFTFKLMGRLDEAIADFDRALALNPGHTLSLINRGNTYAVKKYKNNACADWKQACELGACNNYTQAKKMRYCE